jgi:hypothetical protein
MQTLDGMGGKPAAELLGIKVLNDIFLKIHFGFQVQRLS